MTRTIILALLATSLFAQTQDNVLCLGPVDKNGVLTWVVCPPSTEARIAILEAKFAQLEAEQGTNAKTIQVILTILDELVKRLMAIEDQKKKEVAQ